MLHAVVPNGSVSSENFGDGTHRNGMTYKGFIVPEPFINTLFGYVLVFLCGKTAQSNQSRLIGEVPDSHTIGHTNTRGRTVLNV
jgi:hypothetical protein